MDFLKRLGIEAKNAGNFSDRWLAGEGDWLTSYSPVDGKPIAQIKMGNRSDYEAVINAAETSFKAWRVVPAPQRGQLVRDLADILRANKDDLGRLVSYEMGKIYQEGLGEVQEMIDIADYAVGLSRQLYGLTMHSERPGHRMYEQWHPLGPVGVISAFNFPVAVYAWNAIIAAVCGDSVIWKPSLKTPLCAIATVRLFNQVAEKHGVPGLFGLVMGSDQEVGEAMVTDPRIPLISATGSVRMGKIVGAKVAQRLGRSLLELGGNNALIVTPEADLNLAIPAVAFGAVGTAGQRCTTTRRLIVHNSIKDKVVDRLISAYKQVRIGNPLEADTLMGPLIDQDAVNQMMAALESLKKAGGRVLYGGEKLDRPGFYVTPCIAEAKPEFQIVQDETFAPILYVLGYDDFEEALAIQNGVHQGLSSAVFTRNLLEAEHFLSHAGSDCGIANVNIGTSGAEIGGAFGGEKETGGGRESGSDSWKFYMRRQTNTINYSHHLPLAQGIKFDLN
ncbi:MAG: aldehyde dehydrogenase family protein [Acidobacteria bacterium]|nr:aldehyde dehydrogenase family protein [Acidobacteriota bacterium]MCB9398870.1 aldehyde dehydrogenase family protein [Acidobacteriota bacterium]